MSDPQSNNVGSGKSVMRNHAERPSGQAAEKWHKDSKRLSEKYGVMLERARVQSPTADGFESASKKVYGSAHIDPDCGTYLPNLSTVNKDAGLVYSYHWTFIYDCNTVLCSNLFTLQDLCFIFA